MDHMGSVRRAEHDAPGRPRRAAGRQPGPVMQPTWGVLLVCCLLLGACGGSFSRGEGPGLAPPPLPRVPMRGVWHIIAEGETLWELSRRYNVPLQDLAEINDLPDPDRVAAGMELFIPGRTLRLATRSPPRPSSRTSPGRKGLRRPELPRGTFIWPIEHGRLSSRFGRRWGRHHEGIDIAAPAGTPIRAAADGNVIYSGRQRGYGNLVLLEHKEPYVTVYAHNQVNLVRKGQKVHQAETIARVGSTGRSTGPHLHFEIRDRGKPRNPLFFLDPVRP